MKPFRIVTLVSIMAVISLPVFVVVFVSPSLTGLVEENAKQEAIKVASHLSSLLLPEDSPIEKRVLPQQFAKEAEKVRNDFKALKIKVYSASGETLYSTDGAEAGHINTEPYFGSVVARGRIYAVVIPRQAKTLEGETAAIDIAETYVPVIRGGRFAGAFEIYYNISDSIARLNRVKRHSYMILSATVLCLLGAAFAGLYMAYRGLAARDLARREWEKTFDAVTDPVMLLDSNFRMQRVNRAMAEFLGVSQEAAVGMTCYGRVHCSDRPIPECPHAKLLADGKVHTQEIYEKRIDRHFSVTVFPIFDSRGKLTSSVHYAKDITKRKRAEKELRAAEAKYRIVADNAFAWEFWISPDSRYVYTSPSCERITGYLPEDFAADPNLFLRIVYPDDRQRVAEHQRATLESRAAGGIQFRIMRRDGGIRWIEHICQPIIDSAGCFIGSRGSNNDITERKQMDEALQKSAFTLSEAQRIAHIGSWELDIAKNELKWSDEIFRIFEIDPAEFGASYETFLDLVHPEDREAVDEAYSASIKNRAPYCIAHRIVMPDGRIKHVQEQCETSYAPDGRPQRSIGTVQDITEQKRAEEMLQRQVKNMTALSDIGMAISSSLDIRITLNLVLDRLVAQLGIDAADILLLDPDTLYLTCAASIGFRTTAIRQKSVRMGMGHAGRAAMERRTVIIRDLGDSLTRALKDEGFIAYVAVPLSTQGKIKGVLEIFHRDVLEPEPEWLGFLELMSAQAAIAIDNATLFDSLQRTNVELTLSYDATLEGWGRTLEFRDEDTMGHTARVADMTVRFARLLGIPERDIVHIRRGALLHDIGKISIPDHILLKPGPLTAEEREIMQKHSEYAFKLLSQIPFLRPAIDIPYCHHEKWDGTGFPRGLKGGEIPFSARIFSLVDVWDALRSDRPYRPAWPFNKVREHIRSASGTAFDPSIVESFLELMKECATEANPADAAESGSRPA